MRLAQRLDAEPFPQPKGLTITQRCCDLSADLCKPIHAANAGYALRIHIVQDVLSNNLMATGLQIERASDLPKLAQAQLRRARFADTNNKPIFEHTHLSPLKWAPGFIRQRHIRHQNKILWFSRRRNRQTLDNNWLWFCFAGPTLIMQIRGTLSRQTLGMHSHHRAKILGSASITYRTNHL